jgi:hypothetical protein
MGIDILDIVTVVDVGLRGCTSSEFGWWVLGDG